MTTSPYEGYEDLQPEISDRLRFARERRTNLDQGDFAERIGVSRGTVSNYERGKLPGGPRQRLVLNSWGRECNVTRQWLETGIPPSGNGGGDGLPRLDSNQQPSGYPSAQVIGLFDRSESYAA